MAGNTDLANETAKKRAEKEQEKADKRARKEQEKADKKKAEQEKAEAKRKEKELSGKTRNPLQELSHEFNKNVLGIEGYDAEDEQEEYNKYFKMKPEERQKLIDSGKVSGQKLDVLKQAHADAETGEKKKVEKQVINASTGEKMSLDESKKITEEKAKKEENANKDSTNNTTDNKDSKPKADNELTWADIMKEAGGNKEEAKRLLIEKYPGYVLGEKTKAELGEEGLKEIEEGRAKVIEENETSNKQIAERGLTEGTEGEINATANVLQEKIDDSNNERAKKLANQVDEFMKDDVNDYYIEGLPKGVWRQYKSGAFGYSKEQAQKELDKLHEGEITWSKKRRDYLLKHPELANEKEKEIINSYKEAKNTFGTFILDVLANGLSNASKAVMGKDIDLNAGMTAEMMKTNLNKAIERRNEKYGTSHQNQWRALVDSMDLSKEAKQKLQDVNITRGLQKKIAKLDTETQKLTLDFMAKWNFSPKQIAKVIASKEMLSDDPEAVDTVVASLASDLMNDDGSINKQKVADLAKLLGTSTTNIIKGLGEGLL